MSHRPSGGGVNIVSTRRIFGRNAGVGKPANVHVFIDWIVYVFGPWICSHSTTGLVRKEYRGFVRQPAGLDGTHKDFGGGTLI